MAMSAPSPVFRSPNVPPPPPPPPPPPRSPPSVRGKIPLEKRAAGSNIISKPETVRLVGLPKAVRCDEMLEFTKFPLPDVANAILTLKTCALSYQQVCLLFEFLPTEEEMETLKNYNGDKEQLGKCEQLFLELMKVPHLEAKLKLFAFIMEMLSQVENLRRALYALINAARQLKESSKSRQVMETILTSVNASGSTRKLDTSSLLKLRDPRLIPSLCKLLEEKRPDLLDFAKDLPHLDKAVQISLKPVVDGLHVLSIDRRLVELDVVESQNEPSFQEALKKFLTITENDIPMLLSLKEELEANTTELSKCYGYPSHVPLEHVALVFLHLRAEIKKARYQKACEAEKAKKM